VLEILTDCVPPEIVLCVCIDCGACVSTNDQNGPSSQPDNIKKSVRMGEN
jgi:hypothetical protein